MKKILYIRFNNDQLDLVLKSDEKYQSLGQLPKDIDYDKVVVFLPANLMTWHTLTIKAQNNKQLKSAIPFALANVITKDLDEVYYQYHLYEDQVIVAVIQKSIVNSYLEKLTTLNIKADYLISEFEALSQQDLAAVFDTNSIIIKQNEHYYGIDADILKNNNLSLLDALDEKTMYYAHREVIKEHALNNATEIDNTLIFLAQHISLGEALNFIHVFSGYMRWFKQVKPFAFPLLLLLSLIMSYPALFWLEQYNSQEKINNVNQKMIQLYQRVDPNTKHIFDPYSQLLSLSKVKNKQHKDDFLLMLYLLEQYFDSSIQVERLQYEKQHIIITASSKNLLQLEQFNRQLKNHFQVSVKNSTQHQQVTKMVLELRLKSPKN